GGRVEAMKTLLTSASVFYDAVYVPGGFHGVGLLRQTGAALYFVREAFRHSKTLGATNEGIDLLLEADLPGLDLALHAGTRKPVSRQGVVTAQTDDLAGFLQAFIDAVRRHRHFDRASDRTPA
ncbi:MAG TPA: catalase HPII, partial [Planctomycetota bacterium]|nr:catalase HPII [Planctomycetota bacterium]